MKEKVYVTIFWGLLLSVVVVSAVATVFNSMTVYYVSLGLFVVVLAIGIFIDKRSKQTRV